LKDVQGTGETTLAKAISISLNARFKRIQFTSDLLPADITGITVFDGVKYENEDITDKEFREAQTIAPIFVELFSPIEKLNFVFGVLCIILYYLVLRCMKRYNSCKFYISLEGV